jgi:hypothetical protein
MVHSPVALRGVWHSPISSPRSHSPHAAGVVLTFLIIADATCEASPPSFESAREKIAQTRTLRYRLLRSLFAASDHWKSFDPFFTQKLNTYQASGTAVHRMKPSLSTPLSLWLIVELGIGLAATLAELESEKDIIASDPEKLKVLFHEMTQMCLWCAHNLVIRQAN